MYTHPCHNWLIFNAQKPLVVEARHNDCAEPAGLGTAATGNGVWRGWLRRSGARDGASWSGRRSTVPCCGAMCDHTPVEAGIPGVLIRLVAGVLMTGQAVGRRLRRYGFIPRRPSRHSRPPSGGTGQDLARGGVSGHPSQSQRGEGPDRLRRPVRPALGTPHHPEQHYWDVSTQ